MAKRPSWLTFKNVAGGIVLFYAAAASLALPVPRWTWIWEHEALATEFYNARIRTDLRIYGDLTDRICTALRKGQQPRTDQILRWRALAEDINKMARKLGRKPVPSVRPRC